MADGQARLRLNGSGETTIDAQLQVLNSLLNRNALADALGKSFGGKRDIYKEAGWKKNLSYIDFEARYERDGISKRIIDLPVSAVWNKPPTITDDADPYTVSAFEKAIDDLDDKVQLFKNLAAVDRLARIGKYAILLLGFADGNELAEEVTSASELAYVRAYSEKDIRIIQWDQNPASERFGLPIAYSVNFGHGAGKHIVHHSRIIHVAENTISDPFEGTPALRAPWNYLFNLDLVIAGSGEMFWRGGFGGFVANIAKDAKLGHQSKKEMAEQFDEYIHGLRRIIRTQGVDIQDLSSRTIDPSSNVSVLLDLIAGTTGIPKRLLIGSERGELASSQDKANFATVVSERQKNHAEPVIARPTIDRLVSVGVLPEPLEGTYECKWEDPHAPSEKEKAETAEIKARAMHAAFGPGAATLIPLKEFLTELGWDIDVVQDQFDDEDGWLSSDTDTDTDTDNDHN